MAGYKSPPPQHRFKPGESGNPTGQRRKRIDFEAMLMADIEITHNGKKKRVPTFETQVLVQLKRAIKDHNLAAVRFVFNLLKKYDALETIEASPQVIGVVKSDNLPSDLRLMLGRDSRGRIKSIEEMDEIRQAYFADAPPLMAIRNEIGCYTSNKEFRAQLLASKSLEASHG